MNACPAFEVSRLEREAADERDRREDLAEELDRAAASTAAAGTRADELERWTAVLAAELAECRRGPAFGRKRAGRPGRNGCGCWGRPATRPKPTASVWRGSWRRSPPTATEPRPARTTSTRRCAPRSTPRKRPSERRRRPGRRPRWPPSKPRRSESAGNRPRPGPGREVAATEDRLHREQPRAQDALAGQARAEADRDALRDQLAAARQDRDTAHAASQDAEDRLAALTERAGNTAD